MTYFFDSVGAEALSGICAFIALIIAIVQITQHLRHYNEPMFQRYIVRIIFMVPVYSISAFVSLITVNAAIYITTIRDCYEAWIIYNFMSLCLAYIGGPGAVDIKMQGVVLLPSWAAGTCCLPPLPVNGHFIRIVKQGALQFVFLKPILAILTLVLYATGHYTEGDWSPAGSYLWITIIYNITYTVALYALLLFYMGTHELLAPFRPLLKFILVKSVIFLTFWQGLFIAIAVGTGAVPSPEDGNNIQNFLLCVEMFPASICMLFAFPWSDYVSGSGALAPTNVGHAMSLRDVVTDTVHQFAPSYQDYVLYSDGATKKSGHHGTLTDDNDADLLSNVEMAAGASMWDDDDDDHNNNGGKERRNGGSDAATTPYNSSGGGGGGVTVGRSRYLVNDDDNGVQNTRGGDADARWSAISISPPQ